MPAQNTSTCVIISLEMLLLRASYLWDISLGMRTQRISLRRVLIATSMQLLLACSAWLNVGVELNLLSFFIFLFSIYSYDLPKAEYYLLHLASRDFLSFFYYSCLSQ